MKKLLLLTALLILGLVTDALATGSPGSFRCGTHLVYLGDTKGEVYLKCGPPDFEDGWYDDRIASYSGIRPYTNRKLPPYGVGIPLYGLLPVWVDEWTYNQGPSYFIRILRFENNRLVYIETGNYGY